MPPRLFGLYGAGGFAREVMPIARQQLESSGWTLVFVETQPVADAANGLPILSEDAFFATAARERGFAVAIADSAARQSIAERCEARGARPMTLLAANATVYDANRIGDGSILCAHTTVTSNVVIGRHVHANLYSYIAHDCVVEDWVTLAPRVSCNGNVHLQAHCYIGTGALLRPGEPRGRPLSIGRGAVVGMGAVVTRDVAPDTTVVGNPARPLERR
ncbi:acetyltransferase [Piscinibacter sakaiensis]|uniref:Acetyltransferase (Isoleucine patch superfamily) n=1 Tax=Piscinibacter sakaiensis TaxID=1547922 RepID=A0A0K8P4F4_PISS1|nr:acetyltransferase [Piscinibacter sakaiensis]GAP37527.1 acetyltransferase (isoleucine patch superfamily) [Piscinibacter sakaiensis]